MSKLLKAINKPPFGWHYSWTKLEEDGVTPANDIEDALKQPDAIKVNFEVPAPGRGAGRTHEVTAYIVPDKGLFGAEFALIFTLPQFKEKIQDRLDVAAGNHVSQLHSLFGNCLQGKASTHWDTVLAEYPEDDRTVDTFKEAQKDYLEKVAGDYGALGDCILRFKDKVRKPAALPYNTFHERHLELDRHLASGYLDITAAEPTEQQKAEQIFLAQPKAHQVSYGAKGNEDVEEDLGKLKAHFEACHEKDVADGTFANVLKSQRAQKAARKAKDEGRTTTAHQSVASSRHGRGNDRRRERGGNDRYRGGRSDYSRRYDAGNHRRGGDDHRRGDYHRSDRRTGRDD